MSRTIIPRLFRHMRVMQCPTRGMSYRRNPPVFWRDRRSPSDTVFPDPEFRDRIIEQMQKLMPPKYLDLFDIFMGPRRNRTENLTKSEVAQVKYDERFFEVKLDIQEYTPEELNVKISEDRLVITGKHEQKADDYGFISREFTREFVIPQNIDVESFTSFLSEEGMMVVQARAKGAKVEKERVINIEKPKEKSEPEPEPERENK